MIGIYSSGIWQIPHLQSFLGKACCKLSSLAAISDDVDAIAVWGERPSAQRPIERAIKCGRPVLRLEDGFTRSLGLGVNGTPPLSMIVDDLGIYYDASRPSRLEMLIKQEAETPTLQQEAQRAAAFIVENDISKYNHAPTFNETHHTDVVLVVDQTYGDVSVTLGGATEMQFAAMLSCAKKEHPQSEIWIKTHPDVLTGKKSGYFDSLTTDPRIRLITKDFSPQSLLRQVSHVYTVTSQYGIEALMAGKKVVCFGLPWYAGWGLTDDRHPLATELAARRRRAPLSALVAAAWLQYTHYIDPYTGQPGTLFDVLDYIHMHRQHLLARCGHLWAPGMTLWKSSIVKPFLKTSGNSIDFSHKGRDASTCIVWGIKDELRWRQKASQLDIPVWRMEDGFLRSSGLGSDLLPPLSLVLDKTGIYYDASRPSDLENSLIYSELTTEQQRRAEALQQNLIANKLSKYNLGASWKISADVESRRKILVTGQVENDASIARGTTSINTNLMLLQTVRERYPDAFIIYKPHPDVLVGNRPGHISVQDMNTLANCVAVDADIIECIQQADEIHTMTSQSGFEALMHGKKVFCYGMPFYAGWGLTTDEYTCERRNRRLSITDLVYQTLISYPTYIHPDSKQCIPPEMAMDWLLAQKKQDIGIRRGPGQYLQRQGRKLQMLLKAMKK
ncbi:capsular polysaccharide biosynthesis protein [Kluyvera genomosp. 1]|uniref:capsular polysaccharide biosynthesis protein n=1 Tax=Kluyvera genomosp. 1 TaxID=2774053 RepID=UPI00068DBC5F|nr:capsular polysaccharide biosynthesis protein [Kluyvera genomosp. 1]